MAPLLLRLLYLGKVMKFNFNVFSDSLRASVKGLADVVVCSYSFTRAWTTMGCPLGFLF